MMLSFHQNEGQFPKRRRDDSAERIDEEIGHMQAAYRKIYELDN